MYKTLDNLFKISISDMFLIQNLIQQIPDVSNEEVEDISMIQYTKQDETSKICCQANKKLTRLSSTKIRIEDLGKPNKSGT